MKYIKFRPFREKRHNPNACRYCKADVNKDAILCGNCGSRLDHILARELLHLAKIYSPILLTLLSAVLYLLFWPQLKGKLIPQRAAIEISNPFSANQINEFTVYATNLNDA
ncbi:MAG: hypothetical protein AAFY59_20215, partial [Pseudomonadota bacterium]